MNFPVFERQDTIASITHRTPADAVTTFRAVLHTGGLHAALRHLNVRTRFRFTGVYDVSPPLLRTVRLFDRENPALALGGAMHPVDADSCRLAGATKAPVSITSARRDRLLAAHLARHGMLSYSGVPLRTPSGRARGTLCHFDLRPRILCDAECELLNDVAPVLSAWLARAGRHA